MVGVAGEHHERLPPQRTRIPAVLVDDGPGRINMSLPQPVGHPDRSTFPELQPELRILARQRGGKACDMTACNGRQNADAQLCRSDFFQLELRAGGLTSP